MCLIKLVLQVLGSNRSPLLLWGGTAAWAKTHCWGNSDRNRKQKGESKPLHPPSLQSYSRLPSWQSVTGSHLKKQNDLQSPSPRITRERLEGEFGTERRWLSNWCIFYDIFFYLTLVTLSHDHTLDHIIKICIASAISTSLSDNYLPYL